MFSCKALLPTATLPDAVVLFDRAIKPMPILFPPVVLSPKALPRETLHEPSVLAPRAT